MSEDFNFKMVKNHIKNLINGNNISKADMIELYKTVMIETVQKRVNKLFISNNLDMTIENLVRSEIKSYLQGLMKSQSYWEKSPKVIDSIIKAECDKQIKEIINANFKISINGISTDDK